MTMTVTMCEKGKKKVVLDLDFKKDQTLRPSKVPGEASAVGPSRFYTAVAEHVVMRVIAGAREIEDGKSQYLEQINAGARRR